MTTTYTINKLPASVGDNNVDLPVLTQANLILNLRDSQPEFAVYNNETGDNSLPSRVTSRIAVRDKIALPTMQWTLAFETCQLITDTDSNVSVGADVSFGIWVKCSLAHRPTAAEVSRGFGTVLGLTGASITAGAIDTARISRALFLNPYAF